MSSKSLKAVLEESEVDEIKYWFYNNVGESNTHQFIQLFKSGKTPIENKELEQDIREWVKALKSDKYHQSSGKLYQIDDDVAKHCCLGVAGDLCDINPVILEEQSYPTDVVSRNPSTQKKGKLWRFLSNNSNTIAFPLASMNDANLSFEQIATVIEWKFDL